MKLLQRYIPIFIAVCSLVVATTSLWVSIDAQRTDRTYKELSIKPHLAFESETDWQYRLRNIGVGPAEIRRTTFKAGAHCIDLQHSDRKNPTSKNMRAFSDIVGPLGLELMENKWVNKPSSGGVHSNALPPVPGDVIPAGGFVNVIDFSALGPMLRTRALEHAVSQDGLVWITNDPMSQTLEKLRLRFEYCSISGGFCNAVGSPCG